MVLMILLFYQASGVLIGVYVCTALTFLYTTMIQTRDSIYGAFDEANRLADKAEASLNREFYAVVSEDGELLNVVDDGDARTEEASPAK